MDFEVNYVIRLERRPVKVHGERRRNLWGRDRRADGVPSQARLAAPGRKIQVRVGQDADGILARQPAGRQVGGIETIGADADVK